MKTILYALLALLLLTPALGGCQEKDGSDRRVSLTMEQWKQVRKQLHKTLPKAPQHSVNAVFGVGGAPKIRLVGYDLSPKTLKSGKEFTLTWYWETLDALEIDWKVFVHLRPEGGGGFQNLDHHPVNELYRTHSWENGSFVVDEQKRTLQVNFSAQGGGLEVGLFDEKSGDRMEVISFGDGKPGNEPNKVRAGTFKTQNDRLLIAPFLEVAPVLDGKLTEEVWKRPGAHHTGPMGDVFKGKKVSPTSDVRVAYTKDSLYVAFDVKDPNIKTPYTHRDDTLWKADCVEIYLNPEGDEGTYWEIQLSPGDLAEGETTGVPVFDAYFETHKHPSWKKSKAANIKGIEVGMVRDGTLNGGGRDKGYVMEVKIPFASLGKVPPKLGVSNVIRLDSIPPKEGSTWRVNFYRFDAGEKNSLRPSSWAPSGGDFHNLKSFGTLQFGPPLPPKPKLSKGINPDRLHSPLQARRMSKGGRIKRLPKVFTGNRRHHFDRCVKDVESSEKHGSELLITVDLEGNVTQINQPPEPFISDVVTKCLVDDLRTWKLEMNTKTELEGEQHFQLKMHFQYDEARAEKLNQRLIERTQKKKQQPKRLPIPKTKTP